MTVDICYFWLPSLFGLKEGREFISSLSLIHVLFLGKQDPPGESLAL